MNLEEAIALSRRSKTTIIYPGDPEIKIESSPSGPIITMDGLLFTNTGYHATVTIPFKGYEEVVSKEYITVDEALKLWANGKIVYCEINGGVYTYDYARTQEKGFVAVEDGLSLSPVEITKGKFYTKERTKWTL